MAACFSKDAREPAESEVHQASSVVQTPGFSCPKHKAHELVAANQSQPLQSCTYTDISDQAWAQTESMELQDAVDVELCRTAGSGSTRICTSVKLNRTRAYRLAKISTGVELCRTNHMDWQELA